MIKQSSQPDSFRNPPPAKLPGILAKILNAYVIWQKGTKHIPKILRYSMGVRIDNLFAETIELISEATFSSKEKREPLIIKAIGKNDVLKFMLYALLELEGIDEKRFFELTSKLEEIGKMLFGWKNQLLKQNSANNLKKLADKQE